MVRWRALILTTLASAAALYARAEQTLTLISHTNTWRYFQEGREPNVGWKQPVFNDTAWSQGQGVFAVPADEPLGGVAPLQTVLSLYVPTGTVQVITYYFRTQFDFPYVPDDRFVFTASNLVDDGAVFYVNGTEVGRVRMPTSPPSYGVPASLGNEVSTLRDVLTIPRTALVQGMNTVAVEVHQSSPISADAVFGMSLTARVLDPVEIVRHPEDMTIEEGQTLTLSVDVIGSDPGYQWYRGNTRLTTNTTRELVWGNIKTNQSGAYYVVVSNSLNVVTSHVATVTVLRDTNAPVLLSATEWTALFDPPYLILLTFNESIARVYFPKLDSSATNKLNFTVRELGSTNTISVTNSAPGINQVRLSVSPPLKRTSLYLVTVTNLADARSNIMTQANFAYVGFYQSNALVSLDSIWAWDESGADLGTAWRERDYDDRSWPRGRGVFAFEFDAVDLCAPKNTALSLGPTTHYFRFPFVVPRTSGQGVFRWFAETIDDGAIYYLNGQELRRVNMPAGPVTAATPALAAREGACSRGSINVLATNVVEGTNVLAVEVHQVNPLDFDVAFGVQMNVTIVLPYPVQVPLNIVRAPSGEVIVSWTGREGLLKGSPSPTGPWFPMTTNSPAIVPADLNALFFRLDPFRP